MHPRRDKGPPVPARRRAAALLALAVLLSGCGGAPAGPARTTPGSQGGRTASATLAPGRGSAPAASRLEGAARLAHRFARAWATDIYRRRPPRLPAETPAVGRELAAAATRVPQARRGLGARLLGLRLRPSGPRRVVASADLGDGRFPPFSVGFALVDHDGRWLVTSISPPD